ncbi:MAG: hypothetical protein SFU99_05725 [Saprospiraceae bacterium]|nr:hypothetical protein [Saprospiraceae bacterium]
MMFWSPFVKNLLVISRKSLVVSQQFIIFIIWLLPKRSNISPSPYHPITLFTKTILALFIILIPIKLSSDCTPGNYGFRGYSFINPNIIDANVPSAPLFLDIKAIYEYFGGQKVAQERDNVNEWRERYCKRATADDIYAFIYDTEITDFEQLRTEMNMSDPRLSYPFADNSFARYIKRNNCVETVDYFIYAKMCEDYVIPGEDPWKTPQRDTSDMGRLIDNGLSLFRQTESHYIKLRYAYQIIRLAHYAKKYAQVLSLYDFLMPQIDFDPSIVEYWIEGHRAGALLALGRNVEASYLYSKVFENCPSKAESAFRSFKIRTDEEWAACEKLCQSDKERATLYAMRAEIADSKALEEMRKIYGLDPENRHLEILLVNEIRKLEKDLLGTSFNDEKEHNRRLGYPRIRAGEYVIGLQDFVQQVLKEKQVARPALWQVSLGYLEALAGNYYDAIHTFELAKSQIKDKVLRDQLEAFELVMRISAFTVASDSTEQEVNRIRQSSTYLRYRDFGDFISDKMGVLYAQGNSPGKAYMSNYRLSDLKVNPNIAIIDDLIALCRKTGRNSLETALITKNDGSTIERDLINIKATLLFSEFRTEEALNTLKGMDRAVWDNFGVFNPFIPRLKDCVTCPLPDTANMYNRGELMERILDLESLARGGSERAVEFYFELGIAYYNMTYFSYDWKAMDLFRSGASLSLTKLKTGTNIVPSSTYPLGNREMFDCSRALFYFEKVRQLSTDPEVTARATYWAAKCERNAWYINRVRGVPRTYEYFQILRDNYANTQVYNRIVRECKTFQAYLAK